MVLGTERQSKARDVGVPLLTYSFVISARCRALLRCLFGCHVDEATGLAAQSAA